jgi:hypothetical protein
MYDLCLLASNLIYPLLESFVSFPTGPTDGHAVREACIPKGVASQEKAY